MKLNKILSQPKNSQLGAISTGIRNLDNLIGGLHIGHVCAVGARPAMGKTAFAITLARNISIINKVPTVLFTMENSENNIIKRLMATEFGWGGDNALDSAVISSESQDALSMMEGIGFILPAKNKENYLQRMREAPLWIENGANITLDEVVARLERLKKSDNIKVLIIDGLGWLVAGKTYAEKEQAMVKLVQFAKRLNIAILVTSELNRSVEIRENSNKKPWLYDLCGGLCIETYSSIVMFIYRPEYYGITENEMGSTNKVAYIIVAKNNFGEVGEIRLRFENHARFEDDATIYDNGSDIIT